MTTTTMPDSVSPFSFIRRVGDGAANDFFGYYNKTNWDADGRLMLSHRVAMRAGDLDGTEVASVGYFDLTDGERFHRVGETTTWNWQMGAQLQWLPGMSGRKLIYNSRAAGSGRAINNGFQATIVDIDGGEQRYLPQPIYSVAPDSRWAVTVNYSRLLLTHRTIGYRQAGAEPHVPLSSSDDGLFHMDLTTGATRVIVSLDRLAGLDHRPSMDKAIHWISHAEINTASSRVLFLHRWTERVLDETCFLHRLVTCDPDGGDLRILECSDHPLPQLTDGFDPDAVGTFDYEKSEFQISHPMWVDEHRIIVWGPHDGAVGYHLYDERSRSVCRIGAGVLDENGHMTFSPDGRWLLSDTYPDTRTNIRDLFLWDARSKHRIAVAGLQTDPDLGKHNRCDLHPRWSPDGRQICIDSVHEGPRGLYRFDATPFLRLVDDDAPVSALTSRP